MILVDSAVGSFELQSLIRTQGIACDKQHLRSADACFEGYGPEGMVLVGVERKKIQDALDCVETGRLAGFQLVNMRRQYRFRFVIIEGVWKPHTRDGFLLQEFLQPDGKPYWSDQRPGGRKVMYYKLRRWLFSMTMAGCHVLLTRDITHTAYDICELYHWFQKPWHKHTSMNTLYTGYVEGNGDFAMIPTLDRKPSLTRMWAKSIEGIGVKLSADAERVFKTPIALASADEADWTNVPGVSLTMANDIVKQVLGRK